MKLSTVLVLTTLALCQSTSTLRAQNREPFTVTDDIQLTRFGDYYGGDTVPVTLSPDGRLVAVQSERGVVSKDQLEDEVRIYEMSALHNFVNASDRTDTPQPIHTVKETGSNGNSGCLITHIRWLNDSSGITFLLKNDAGHSQLILFDFHDRHTTELTPKDRDVTGFEIRDRHHYVFTLGSMAHAETGIKSAAAEYVVKPGQMIWDFLLPERPGDRSELWDANGKDPHPVLDPQTDRPIILYSEGALNLSLSPDGRTLVTAFPVGDIPKEWETEFPPPYGGSDYRLKASHQDLSSSSGILYVSTYEAVDLASGVVTPLIGGAPTAERTGWWETASASPAWSDDGKAVILPGAYLPNQPGPEVRPCIAVRELSPSQSLQCVAPLKRNLANGFENGYNKILQVSFAKGGQDSVSVRYITRDPNSNDLRRGSQLYRRVAASQWTLESDRPEDVGDQELRVEVQMSFKDRPKLVAIDGSTNRSRIVWDPDRGLDALDLGKPSLYHWSDSTGMRWNGILYKPANYVSGRRYPLVIETHGYNESLFEPSGGFPSAFAAQELASSGIAVLHMQDCAGRGTAEEGPCNVRGYESAVKQLEIDGLIDPNTVGIIGFSRTVFYALEALTTSTIHFSAASITDGITMGYFAFILDSGNGLSEREYDGMLGGPPVGSGLQEWFKRNPDFKMDKVATPLRIVGCGEVGSLVEWEPYALLREMHRPVEFTILKTGEHIFTNPTIRLAAQGGNVDWFRFWLQGYEDPSSAKAEQYKRWEHLRELRDADAKTLAEPAQSGGK